VSDFVIEGDDRSLHVLNAVSPAFTCALPFADFVVDRIAGDCVEGRALRDPLEDPVAAQTVGRTPHAESTWT
jgi:hypothetical protein